MDPTASGRIAVLTIIAGILLLSVVSWYSDPEMKDIVRFAITCVLCWFLYKGKNWARWVFGILFGLAGLFSLYAFFALPLESNVKTVIGAMSVFYTVSPIILFTPKIIGPYFDASDT